MLGVPSTFSALNLSNAGTYSIFSALKGWDFPIVSVLSNAGIYSCSMILQKWGFCGPEKPIVWKVTFDSVAPQTAHLMAAQHISSFPPQSKNNTHTHTWGPLKPFPRKCREIPLSHAQDHSSVSQQVGTGIATWSAKCEFLGGNFGRRKNVYPPPRIALHNTNKKDEQHITYRCSRNDYRINSFWARNLYL